MRVNRASARAQKSLSMLGCVPLLIASALYRSASAARPSHGSSAPLECRRGSSVVAAGWKGKGYGEDWCNFCHCLDGILQCTKRACGHREC